MDFAAQLQSATAGIDKDYFQLPVYGKESPVYRERCYCYELYHQLRKRWKNEFYKLCGEIDKSGHPVIRGNTKPDFLIHAPEAMDHNFAVIEVKPINGKQKGIAKDIETLGAFLDDANYEHAYYLIYGSEDSGRALEIATRLLVQINDSKIQLWHHSTAGTPAIQVNYMRLTEEVN